ncbi:tether containing UBX domain for GLUT4 [Latimeria chalumnae]|uniref:tether containing UBX domain for GLUT4 n=1 Tax=Latimeria chalumnae TaxID=7897 RepID=UPI0003C12C34|nr:PREDICTED: tether containing UBX domain for GLUT4 [Latimeria chalumnae]|eukprot:XP_005989118.1 PREDICTED: tether containing UBX domain for GLUT4 [Latimeria chalumnae]
MAATRQAVTVLSPNGRRQTVSVSPSTPLLQILEEVCRKQQFSVEEYDLKFQRTVLDLSIQWRFAKLPNNAKLEMVTASRQRPAASAADSMVRIALQLEDGSRLQDAFHSSQTLWEIIQHFPQTKVLKEQPFTTTPVCVYMRDEVVGETALRMRTLKSLGLTGGNAIIRFVEKKSTVSSEEEPMDMGQIPENQPVQEPGSQPSAEISSRQLGDMSSSEMGLGKSTDSENVLADASKKDGIATRASARQGTPREGALHPLQDLSAGHSPLLQEMPDTELSGIKSEGDRKQKPKEEEISSEPEEPKAGCSTEWPVPSSKQTRSVSPQRAATALQPKASSFIPFSGSGQRLGGTEVGSRQTSQDKPTLSKLQTSLSSPGGPPNPKKSKTTKEKLQEKVKAVERQTLVFHLDTENRLHREDLSGELPDEFFEVTVDDIRKRFAELKSERKRLEEAPLMTKSLREAQMIEKMKRYPKVAVRVLFPDRHVLQGFFLPTETVGVLREFVRNNLACPNLPFHLFIAPPKLVLSDPAVTLFQANLFPAALVHFSSEVKRDHHLKPELLESRVSPLQADSAVTSQMPCSPTSSSSSLPSEVASPPPSEMDKGADPGNESERAEELELQADTPKPAGAESGQVPKWLKLPGKR